MHKDAPEMSLATMKQGAVVEQFDDAIQRVIENIADPNTKAKAKRSVTLKVTFVPDEERELLGIEASVSASFAPAASIVSKAWVTHTRDGLVIAEHDPNQRNLFEEPPADVTPLRAVGGEDE